MKKLLFILLSLLLFTSCEEDDIGRKYKVRYEVRTTSDNITIKYENDFGQLIELDYDDTLTNWCDTFRDNKNKYLRLSVKNKDTIGEIFGYINVNNEIKSADSSETGFSISYVIK